jgi:hypothetical protein
VRNPRLYSKSRAAKKRVAIWRESGDYSLFYSD